MKNLNATPAQIEATFTEWDRRYRADPTKFQNEAARLLKGTAKSYGQAATPYFLKLLGGIQKAKRKR